MKVLDFFQSQLAWTRMYHIKVLSYGQLFPMCCMNLTQTVFSMSSVSWEFF